MQNVQLLSVENAVTEKGGRRQEVSFLMLVEDAGHRSQVDVLWAGGDGVWNTLPATFHSSLGGGREHWRAHAAFDSPTGGTLPGAIQCAVRCRSPAGECWDNNGGRNHASPEGLTLGTGLTVVNTAFQDRVDCMPTSLLVEVAVAPEIQPEDVTVHWTTDGWKHAHRTPCAPTSAQQPGARLWKASLHVGSALLVEYCISWTSAGTLAWDNNRGSNFAVRRDPLRILTLNLHCFQEEEQDAKFSQIARAIHETRADVVCLQEVAEPWNNGQGDWTLNSARTINQRLPTPFHVHTDWAHLGFGQYREGVAILSRFPFESSESRFVSASQDPRSIHTRKVVMGRVRVPGVGLVNIYSVHLSWWEDGFANQFEALRAWADEKHAPHVEATLLCGDFNIRPASKGYHLVVDSRDYRDGHLEATLFSVSDQDRIDYVFRKSAGNLRATASRCLFKADDYGVVSDHPGYLVTFAPEQD